MKLKDRVKGQIGVIYLYDPIPLEKVSLDQLKAHFPSVASYLPESEVLTAESTEAKIWAQIFSARTEFVEQNEATEYSASSLDPIRALISALPPLRVRSFGINFDIKGTVDGYHDAGEFVTKTFIKDVDKLQEKLGAKLIASAQRFTYGEPSRYYDVRVTPEEVQSPVVHVQLHRHVEGEIADANRLFDQTKSGFEDGFKEFNRIVELL